MTGPTSDRGPGNEPTAMPDRPAAAAWRNLLAATLGFTLTFWTWNLVAPPAGDFDDRLHMSSSAQSLLVAVPVPVGSLGRVPVDALTDRYGARLMFPLVSALTKPPVLLLVPAKGSYGALIVVGFFLGLGGTTFAIGVPLVNAWFPPAHRGAALGVFGMGMGGVALSGYSRRACTSTARACPSWCSRRPSRSTPSSPPCC